MNRFNQTKKASILGVVGNLFLLVIKGIVGFIFSSQAMVADAANSAGDIFASLMSFIGNKIASEPSDESHNFGHGKAEYVFSLFISISMLFVSAKLLYDSGMSLIEQKLFTFSWFLVLVCIITIITKFYLYMYTKKIYKQYNDLLLKASMTDHRNDCILTSCTLISIIFSLFGIFWVDGIVGMAISAWIFYTGIKIFIESYNVLMDKSIDDETKDMVYRLIAKHKEVKKVNHFNSTPVGYKYQISFTIFVDGRLSTFESHKIANHLEKEIDREFPEIYLTVIHVNPIDVKK